MEEFGEVPRYIRYDFLITFLGFLFLGTWWYFNFVRNIQNSGINILFVISIPFVLWGLGEMYNNYQDDRDLLQLQRIVERNKILKDIAQDKLILPDKRDLLRNLLKKEINNLIEKKKDN